MIRERREVGRWRKGEVDSVATVWVGKPPCPDQDKVKLMVHLVYLSEYLVIRAWLVVYAPSSSLMRMAPSLPSPWDQKPSTLRVLI